jgi:sporulation protein YlmC with PRC-barrel domain
MPTRIMISLLAATVLSGAALAQTTAPSSTQTAPAATNATPKAHSGQWRSSKLIGVNVYNEQNEKLGDISEILLDKSGKVQGVVIGVGGFLGMGQHDIKVEMSKLKFVDEPVRTSSTSSSSTSTSGSSTTTGATRSSNTPSTTTSSSGKKWYPDHAVLSGASKDQLKSMPQFKYD